LIPAVFGVLLRDWTPGTRFGSAVRFSQRRTWRSASTIGLYGFAKRMFRRSTS